MASLHAHGHLAAFSSLLAHDPDASKLHMRDLQVIALLVAHDVPLSIGAIATMLSVSSPHISRVCDRLVTRDLLVRNESPTDRRIALLTPTPAGRALDERVARHYQSSAIPA
jgi:DNA-binding MarR family transcriptional regulator